MRYVPNIIPRQHQVLLNYFKGNPYAKNNVSDLNIFYYIYGALSVIGAVFFYERIILSMLLLLMAIVTIPYTTSQIEKFLRFTFKDSIKIPTVALILCFITPLFFYYKSIDDNIAYQQKLSEAATLEAAKLQKIKEQAMSDSLTKHIVLLASYIEKKDTAKCHLELKKAEFFVFDEKTKGVIERAGEEIYNIETQEILKGKNYTLSLTRIDHLLENQPNDSTLLCNKAVCLSKLNKTGEAVICLKQAYSLGSKNAEELYNKINPVKKRVIGYVTRCCDGSDSPSNAKGRGACSHHGGVCDWNAPIYQTYREYE